MRRVRSSLQVVSQNTGSSVKWSKQGIKRKGKQGAHAYFLRKIEAEDPEILRQLHGMTRGSFCELLAIVSPLVSKRDTHLRSEAI